MKSNNVHLYTTVMLRAPKGIDEVLIEQKALQAELLGLLNSNIEFDSSIGNIGSHIHAEREYHQRRLINHSEMWLVIDQHIAG